MPILMIQGTLISYDFRYEHYQVPAHIRNIADRCFNERWELEWLELPAEMESIGSLAFRKCISLRRIDMPKQAESVGNGLFTGCSNLRCVTMPVGTAEIDYEMFRDCQELMEVVLPETVERIHPSAFVSCPKLNQLAVPSSVFPLLPDSVKPIAALTYMSQGADCVSKVFDAYAKEHEAELLELAIRRNNRSAVGYMAAHHMLSLVRIPDYLEKANLAKRTEIAAILLEYGGRNRPRSQVASVHPTVDNDMANKDAVVAGVERSRKDVSDTENFSSHPNSSDNEFGEDVPDMYDWDPFE